MLGFHSGITNSVDRPFASYIVSVTIDTNLSFFTKYVLKSLDSTSQNMLSFVSILEKV